MLIRYHSSKIQTEKVVEIHSLANANFSESLK